MQPILAWMNFLQILEVYVRDCGQLFAMKTIQQDESKTESIKLGAAGVSFPVRGPVTVPSAFSVDITLKQRTKSVFVEGDGTERGTATMGMKYQEDR